MSSALRLIMVGGVYVPPNSLTPAVPPQVMSTWEQSDQSTDVDGLTERQREVLKLLGEGKSNKEIARELGLSLNTVNRTKAALRGRASRPGA
jgi:DNA-binding NarL/FixJ family response regulator